MDVASAPSSEAGWIRAMRIGRRSRMLHVNGTTMTTTAGGAESGLSEALGERGKQCC
jgi:hypothetical protein